MCSKDWCVLCACLQWYNITFQLCMFHSCRGIENRLLLIVVIIIELLVLIGVTYWKFFS